MWDASRCDLCGDRLVKGRDVDYDRARAVGIQVPYRYMHLFEYLRDYLGNNRDDITRLNRRVACQPNCAVRWLPEQNVWLDEIFGLIGVQRVSRRYEGVDALCCGGQALGEVAWPAG